MRDIKIVGICGIPGTGKTTIIRGILERLGKVTTEVHKYHTLQYLWFPELSTAVLGIYKGDPFDGTDKLSMAVINDAEDWLRTTEAKRIIFEGDRLFCDRWMLALRKEVPLQNLMLLKLWVDKREIADRWEIRSCKGLKQSNQFLRGRITKYKNLQHNHPYIMDTDNTDELALENNIRNIRQFLGLSGGEE